MLLRYRARQVLQTAGAAASLAALAMALIAITSGLLRIAVFLAGLLSVGGAVLWIGLAGRREVLRWTTIIDLLNRMIRSSSSTVFLFGGDLTWAEECEDAIRAIVDRGRAVTVIAPDLAGAVVEQNHSIVVRAGASLCTSPVDVGIRGALVDPHDRDNAAALLVRKVPAKRMGDRSMAADEKARPYAVQIYTTTADQLVIQLIAGLADVLGSPAGGPEAPRGLG